MSQNLNGINHFPGRTAQDAVQDMLAQATAEIHDRTRSMTGTPHVEVLSICWHGTNLAFSSTVMEPHRVVQILDTVRQRLAPSGLLLPGLGG